MPLYPDSWAPLEVGRPAFVRWALLEAHRVRSDPRCRSLAVGASLEARTCLMRAGLHLWLVRSAGPRLGFGRIRANVRRIFSFFPGVDFDPITRSRPSSTISSRYSFGEVDKVSCSTLRPVSFSPKFDVVPKSSIQLI